MPEKPRILIASVLKPTSDPRMRDKMAHSLILNDCDVAILGRKTEKFEDDQITTFPIQIPSRLSFSRLLAKWKLLKAANSFAPQLVIVGSHELLLPALVLRLKGIKVIYDVRENYFVNLWNQEVYPPVIRHLLAIYTRFKETLAQLWCNDTIAAEKIYQRQIKWLNRSEVVENKSTLDISSPKEAKPGSVVISGTLGSEFGTQAGIRAFLALHNFRPDLHLTIIGYTPKTEDQNQILEATKNHPSITAIGLDKWIPPSTINETIQQAEFGLITYPPAKHFEGKIPTKIYDYLLADLKIISFHQYSWTPLVESFGKHVFFNPNAKLETIPKLDPNLPKHPKPDKKSLQWSVESKKLIHLINKTLRKYRINC